MAEGIQRVKQYLRRKCIGDDLDQDPSSDFDSADSEPDIRTGG